MIVFLVAFFYFYKKLSVLGSRVYVDTVSSTDSPLLGCHESGSSVPSDRWLGQGGLGPRKTSAAHDGGSSLDGARLGQADMQGTGVLSWGPAEDVSGGTAHRKVGAHICLVTWTNLPRSLLLLPLLSACSRSPDLVNPSLRLLCRETHGCSCECLLVQQ